MHRTARPICFFCDFRLLLSQTGPARPHHHPPPPTRALGARYQARGHHRYSSNAARIHLQQQLIEHQQQRIASYLRVFGISMHRHPHQPATSLQPRLFRPQRQAVCVYTTASTSRSGGACGSSISSISSSSAVVAAPRERAISGADNTLSLEIRHTQSTASFISRALHSSTAGLRTAVSSRILVTSSRLLSTSTSTTIAPVLDADLSSSATVSDSASTPISISTSTSTTLGDDIGDPLAPLISPASSDFQSLFPEIPTSFVGTSSRNSFAPPDSRIPWRNGLMEQGTELEESLRKSVYQRDSIQTWWPLYERVARQWRDVPPSSSGSGELTALGRADFMRLIGALKVAPPSHSSNRLIRLEQVFEDFHRAINVPKSNAKIYSAFLETLHFWRMDNVIPEWVQRIKSKIGTSHTLEPLSGQLRIRESSQEQYHDLLRALANTNQIDAMIKCLEELKTSDSDLLQPTVRAYDTMLEVHMKNKDAASAMKVFQEIQEQGLLPRLTTFNILLRGHLENKDGQAAQRVLESLLLTDIRPDIYTFNLLMSGYLKMGEIETVNGFFKGLGEYGLVPNSKTYRILMKTHLRQGQVNKVVDLFCKLKDSSRAELAPRSEDYCVLVQALASHGRMSDALRVMRELKETAKVPVTTPIYNVFLNQYAREGEVDSARRILNRIISEKLPLVDGSFNPLIRAYLAQKDFAKAEEIIQLMIRYGVEPTRATYNILISSTKSSGYIDGAMMVYDRMMAVGVEPDVWTYNALLDLLVERLSPQNDIKRVRDVKAASEEQVKEYMPRVESLLQDMKAKGVNPDLTTYGKLIHQYVILRDIEQAEILFHELLKSGITPNGHIFNNLMNGFTLIDEMDKALELFRRMPKYGVEPDAITFTTLIKGFANTNQMTLAQDFANSLQQQSSRIPMDNYCLNTLMQLAQKSNQPGMALDFFEMMRGRGIEPNNVTYTILLNALSKEYEKSYSQSSETLREGQGRDRRGGRAGMSARSVEAEAASEAVESLLDILKQDSPLHHSEITTVISAYFRLGRPLAAIEFFKTSLWRANPRLSTTNCGALFHGLLAPEHRRRYDGIVLNLYTRMLAGTKEVIRIEEDRKRYIEAVGGGHRDKPLFVAGAKDRGVSSGRAVQRRETTLEESSWTLLLIPPQESFVNSTKSQSSRAIPSNGLPTLDLITMHMLFNSFSKRQNWSIMLRLWQDLESVGAEKLYPFEMPLEFLGWAAQAYHSTPDRDPFSASPSRGILAKFGRQHKGESHSEKAEKLLRRMWSTHHWMGIEWSIKIYGYNIFEHLTPTASSVSSSSTRPTSATTTTTNSTSTNATRRWAATAATASSHSSSPLSPYVSPRENRTDPQTQNSREEKAEDGAKKDRE